MVMAIAFDLAQLETRGTPVPVVPTVLTTPFGAVDAVAAGNGTLAYASGVNMVTAPRTLIWMDRQGREIPIPAPARPYGFPRLSPDGTRVVLYAQDGDQDLWVWDFARSTLTRLTFDPGLEQSGVWAPDGRRFLFSSDPRAVALNLYVQAADGSGSATRITTTANQQIATGITPDGAHLVIQETTPTRQRDLRLLTFAPTVSVEPLLETPFDERGGIVSPDGHWLAYESNSTGRFEIYVRPFPNVADGQWQVSNAGGVQPLWSHGGRELFYVASDGSLLSVPVTPSSTRWIVGSAVKLVDGRYYTGAAGGNLPARQYDVTPDDQRFLFIKEGSSANSAVAVTQITIVQHWFEELKRLVPTN